MDMFSLGVLLFVMLTGNKPMKSEQARKLSYSKLEAAEYPKMQNWSWKQLSQPARKLVLQLMERDPANRITAAQACSPRSAQRFQPELLEACASAPVTHHHGACPWCLGTTG